MLTINDDVNITAAAAAATDAVAMTHVISGGGVMCAVEQ